MKRQIFGRKVGTKTEFKLLITSPCATSSGLNNDTEKLRRFEIMNTRNTVKILREKSIEGFVMFEGDITQYMFTPQIDFDYPLINSNI